MSQETINILLALLVAVTPVITLILQKTFSRGKDRADYSSDLLQIANDATDALRKARDELTITQEGNDKTIADIRSEHEAAIKSIRTEYDQRHERLKNRISELEKVQKIYNIQFDLITHPQIEVKNVKARAMDDPTASQKVKIISPPQPPDAPKVP